MKNTRLTTPLLITLLLTIPVMAQEAADTSAPPDVVVLEKSWREERIDPRRATNPLKPNEDLMRATREQKEYIKSRDTARTDETTTPRMPGATTPDAPTPEWEMMKTYVYKAKIKNTGTKTIKQLDWEYQFLDPDTQQVKEQRKITSSLKLFPGKSKVLNSRSSRQPTIIVDAGKLDRKYRNQFAERVVITRIFYADGSVWIKP